MSLVIQQTQIVPSDTPQKNVARQRFTTSLNTSDKPVVADSAQGGIRWPRDFTFPLELKVGSETIWHYLERYAMEAANLRWHADIAEKRGDRKLARQHCKQIKVLQKLSEPD